MSFTNTDFGPGGQGLPQGQISCANGHPNSGTAKFCSTCGVAMPEPIITQHESIDAARRGEGPFMFECTNGHPCHESVTTCFVCGAPVQPTGYFTCPQGHFTKADIGPDGNRYCATCHKAIDPAQLPSDRVHPSLITGKPVPNKPMQRTNAFGTSTQQGFTGTPDERDRPRVSMLWLWWFVFSPVVWFMAPSYANKAKRLGFRETARYWVVWWLSVLPFVALIALFIAAAMATSSHSSNQVYPYNSYTPPTTTQQAYAPPTTQYRAPTTTQAAPTTRGTGNAGSGSGGYPQYAVTQGTGDALRMTNAIAGDTSSYWSNSVTGVATMPLTAVCEVNTDSTVGWQFNCNITFMNGGHNSYWASWSPDGRSINGNSTYIADQRTHQ